MRKIITTTFVTLDGVMQGQGGPEEDTEGGFTQGGWSADYGDDMEAQIIDDFMKIPFELLLGRKTYDIWAAYWPYTKDAPHIATPFNATKKYVVSHASAEPSWPNSFLVTGDVVSKIKELKEMDAPDLWVWGSGNLIQTLLNHDLVDEMYIWTYPVTLGAGKRLFKEGTQPAAFRLASSQVTSKGAIIARYERAGK
ncbi:MAG: dihydrofolate reductase [Chloroflexi bacterium]|nr:dihydrofolate reductase [Chloroflexota bacterium]OJV91058.1 MAG: riboflavin biosynthesis protein RibD [Chloroflexi bacterium 54-19]